MASTVDIADALDAVEQRLNDNWGETPVAYQNRKPDGEWPPVAAADAPNSGAPLAWVYCELISGTALIRGFGTPGSQTIQEPGIIKLTVMVPKDTGLADARDKASRLGQIFRQQKFFTDDPTAYVRSYTPTVGEGDLVSEDGNTVAGACCRIPFDFFHQA